MAVTLGKWAVAPAGSGPNSCLTRVRDELCGRDPSSRRGLGGLCVLATVPSRYVNVSGPVGAAVVHSVDTHRCEPT